MAQQPSLFDRLIEHPLVIAVAGTFLGMYLIGTLEERRAKRELQKETRVETPAFLSEEDLELWEKFRDLCREEIGNPDKDVKARLDLLNKNLGLLQANVEELLDRTEQPIPKGHQEVEDVKK